MKIKENLEAGMYFSFKKTFRFTQDKWMLNLINIGNK